MAECYSYSVCRVDDGGWEDEEVSDVGKEVGCYYERKGSVDDAGEVAGWVYEFACYVVDLFVA